MNSWQSLVQVCRRWRGLVFGSPRCLNLQLCCTIGTSARISQGVWPALPLYIKGNVYKKSVDNVIAELKHSDRIRQILLVLRTTLQIEEIWTQMRVPFPELAYLSLANFSSSDVPVLPDSFLGESAPRLRFLRLHSIPFPGLSRLLLSPTHLVRLYLHNIPHSGYISPEVMATCLSTLTSLKELLCQFESPQSSPDQESRRSSSLTRSVLPALTKFRFKGENDYLEELVARIDSPRLHELEATFFNDINFNTQELIRFVSHSSTLKAPNQAHIFFDSQTASVKLQPTIFEYFEEYFEVRILCREPDWQLSSLTQICTTSLPLLTTTEDIFIYESKYSQLDWKDRVENIEWLDLLLPFTAVKNLYLSHQIAPRIAPALQETTRGGTTEVLSTLQKLYLEKFLGSKPVQECIESFISARQLTNHPVVISVWDRFSGRRIRDMEGQERLRSVSP